MVVKPHWKRLILLLLIIFVGIGCNLFNTRKLPSPPKFNREHFSLKYIKENSIYISDSDSVELVVNKILAKTEIIWPKPISFYLHTEKTITNIKNWKCLGLFSYNKNYNNIWVFLRPNNRLWFIKNEPVVFQYNDRWLSIFYAEDLEGYESKLDSLFSIN